MKNESNISLVGYQTAVDHTFDQFFQEIKTLSGNCAKWVNNAGKSFSLPCTIAPVFDQFNVVGALMVFQEHPSGTSPDLSKSMAEQIYIRKKLKSLVMDEDEMVRNITARMLIHLGYNVSRVKDGEEAIKTIQKGIADGQPIDILVLDLIVRDGMGGKEALTEIKKLSPDIKAILTSGHTDDTILRHYWEHGFTGVIRKPFVIKELDRAIFRALKS